MSGTDTAAAAAPAATSGKANDPIKIIEDECDISADSIEGSPEISMRATDVAFNARIGTVPEFSSCEFDCILRRNAQVQLFLLTVHSGKGVRSPIDPRVRLIFARKFH